jgi:hypothetical protein
MLYLLGASYGDDYHVLDGSPHDEVLRRRRSGYTYLVQHILVHDGLLGLSAREQRGLDIYLEARDTYGGIDPVLTATSPTPLSTRPLKSSSPSLVSKGV